MFKKIEIWILYFFIIIGLPITLFFGFLVRQELTGSIKLGKVSKTALFLAEIPVNLRRTFISLRKNDTKIADRFPSLDGFNGKPNLNESYLLLSRFDGHLKQGIVELVDLRNFNVLHTWNPDFENLNKSVKKIGEFKNIKRDHNDSRQTLIHPKLTSDGGLIFNSSPLRKIDSCSKLIFQNQHNVFHHSIETDIDSNIWVSSYIFPQSLPIEKVGRKNFDDKGYLDDGIVKLSSDGKILFEKSVSQIFIDNGLEYLLFAVADKEFTNDPIHINDIQPVDYDGKFWAKGDVFLTLSHQSMVLLYRPITNKIIWKGTGPFFHPHDVDILDDKTISVFNNNLKYFIGGQVVDGHNEVIKYNFETNQYSFYLNESLIKNDVRTPTQGRSQILSNGDLFLEETDYGRTLYFDSDGSLRWTHFNRAADGNAYIVGWSRILYTDEDIKIVNNFLKSRGKCDERI